MKYDNITINNYRGIRHCVIDGLSRINLFFGKNNCGKSSVLESIFLLSGPNLPILPLAAYATRGINRFSEPILESLFYGADRTNKINITTTGMSNRNVVVELTTRTDGETSLDNLAAHQTNDTSAEYGLDIKFEIDSKQFESHLRIDADANKGRGDQNGEYKETVRAKLLTSQLNDNVISQYAQVIKRKQEGKLFRILRIIEPRLKDIQIGDGGLMADVGYAHRIPIKALGDGIRRAFSVILSIQECAGGVLLIDELENGLHYSVLKELWDTIILACRTYDVQLFASTHSLELIRDLADDECQEQRSEEVAAYRLIKTTDDEVKALRYDFDTLRYNINQDIEVR